MQISAKRTDQFEALKTDCLIIPLQKATKVPSFLSGLNKSLDGLLAQLIKQGDLKLTPAQQLLVPTPSSVSKRLLFVGVSKTPKQKELRQISEQVVAALKNKVSDATWLMDATQADALASDFNSAAHCIQELSSHMVSKTYQYDETLSEKAKKQSLKEIVFAAAPSLGSAAQFKRAVTIGQAKGEGINLAKHLGNLPANICTPSYLAKQAQKLQSEYTKLNTQILSETQLKKLKMGALLSVTAGTDEPAKVIVMEYKGGKASDKPEVLVGKGVTFDSGGISLKPGGGMDEMKYDMCGAASVFGAIKAAAQAGLNKNIVGIVGAVENMPSGQATKPGDVVTSMSGQTIEVLNTDAEGRLVLCDLLTYAEKFKPKSVIDIATLTGACIVALGKHASGLYANDEKLQQSIVDAGQSSFDRVWPMPLWEEYDQQLKSNFADIANIGGPQAGSVTAACFLARFTKKYKWAHIDIAGPAWVQGANKGATGRPVGLLFDHLNR